MKLFATIAAAAATLALAACGPSPVCEGEVCPAPVQSDDTAQDMLMGGMLGYMLGSAGNRSAAPHHTTVVNRTVVRNVYRSRPAARSVYRSSFKPSRSYSRMSSRPYRRR